jgi:phage terminase large subunit
MGKTLNIQATTVFEKTNDAINNPNIRFLIHQGGTRSSKTYSICQILVIYCLTNPNKIVSIIRKTFPSLRASVMRDLFEVMDTLGVYTQKNHNKTENLYKFDNGSIIEFFSADDEQKLRGRKRDILWVNEANDINFEEFTQLNIRTTDKLIFDFNPSDNFSWLYDLISREDAVLIKSTYKDNPFLGESQIKEIENLINYDISYYNIYCLGERGTGKTTIWTNWKYYDIKPETKTRIYGLDFGFRHSTALVECNFIDDSVYVKEKLYKEGLTSGDLIREMESLQISKTDDIICDSARPDIIEDLRRSGYKVNMAIKNVLEGIDSVKSIGLYVDKYSLNLIKEISSYKWKTNGDIVLNEPVKLWDDAADALRYAVHWYKIKNIKAVNYGQYAIM